MVIICGGICVSILIYKTFLQSYLKKEVKAQKSNENIFFLFGKEFGFWKNCLENIEKLTAVAFDVDNWHRFSRCSPSMSWLWATTWMIRPQPPSHARHLCTAQSCLLTRSCLNIFLLYMVNWWILLQVFKILWKVVRKK